MAPLEEKTPARFSANGANDLSEVTRNAYLFGVDGRDQRKQRRGRWNPLNWAWWKRSVALAVIVVIILAAVLGGVLGSRASSANSYPTYSKLNYSQHDSFSGTTFFQNFNYFNTYDPTGGFVIYDSPSDALMRNLTFADSQNAIVRVENKEVAPDGRHSVRIVSKSQYNSGLFVFDIAHAPYGCATWPAIWLVDQDNWPYHGEIDVIETVNQGTTGNQMTLHTSAGCTMEGVKREETGAVISTDCLNSTDNNAGCGVRGAPTTYGPQFNENGGGIYAMELRDDGIRTWFFPRNDVPQNVVAAQSPDPSSWGTALADFPNTKCDIGTHFQNLSIVIDIDLCGSWAGSPSVYNQQDSCPGDCQTFVANNASAFDEAYWTINSIKVYSAS